MFFKYLICGVIVLGLPVVSLTPAGAVTGVQAFYSYADIVWKGPFAPDNRFMTPSIGIYLKNCSNPVMKYSDWYVDCSNENNEKIEVHGLAVCGVGGYGIESDDYMCNSAKDCACKIFTENLESDWVVTSGACGGGSVQACANVCMGDAMKSGGRWQQMLKTMHPIR